MTRARVLVPIRVLEGESVSLGLMELLGTVDVTVLGYHVLPEQTPPDQARLQYEERATEALEDVAQEFRRAGGDADHRLVFTADRTQTVARVAEELDVQATVVTGATGEVDRLLVSLTGDVAVDRILSFVTDLVGERDIDVTLFAATGEGADATTTEELTDRLDAAADRLGAADLDVETRVVTDTSPFEALVGAAADHDAIVMGERAPSLRSFLFGDEAQRVATESVGPVVVVRRDRPDETNETDEVDETNETDEADEVDETNETDEVDETNETDELDETNEAR